MKNRIVVEFGDNLITSIFYWHDVEGSLQTLKENVEKRFTIHPDHQIIRSRYEVLNEETLYIYGGFVDYYKLNVDITEPNSYPNIVSQRREGICKKIETFQIEIPQIEIPKNDEHKPKKTMEFKTKPDLTMKDLKKTIGKSNKLDGDFIALSSKKSPSVLLDDEQLLADLLLDLNEGELLELNLNMMMEKKVFFTPHSHHMLQRVKLELPYSDSNRYSLVHYPYLEIGLLGISALKSWVEANYEIPCAEQLILDEYFKECDIIESETFPEHMCNTRMGVRVKLFVYSTSDKNLTSLYQKLGIQTILPVNVSGFGTSNILQYHYRRGKEKLDVFIENSLQIPKLKQRLFVDGCRVTANDIEKFFLSERASRKFGIVQNNSMIEGEGNLTENAKVLPVKLVVQVDDPKTELSERAKQIGLSCIRSVVIKHSDPENPTIFYDCPLSKLEGLLETNEKELKRLLAEQHQDISPEDVCLLHNRDSITSTKNIEGLFIEGDSIQETLELTLEIKPNEDEGMQRFCRKYDLSPYKQVIIKFLTGEFSFDILSGANTTIGQIKDEIYKAKSIPIHLQQLYHENIEVPNDAQNSTFIAQMMMISGKPITLNLIVKPAQTFKIYVKKDYYLNEQLEIEILETATILDFKEEISVRSGVPSKLIKIFRDRCFDDDSQPLWNCYFHKTNYKIWVYKIVIVLIDNEGVVKREHYIIKNKTETLGNLHEKYSRRFFCNVSLKSKGLKSNTLLNDLGETEITFVVTNRRCSIM